MKRSSSIWFLLLLIVPSVAWADTAYTTQAVNLRTGPDSGYPPIVTLRAGTPVDIYGCINDWSWCDVSTGRERGWVSASYLDYAYRGRRVAVYEYGPQLGLPILSFVLGTYWDSHYRNRGWYRDRDRWTRHRPVSRPRPSQSSRPPASGGKPSSGSSRPPASGGKPSSGSSRPPASGGKPSSGPSRPPASGGKPSSGSSRPPTSGGKPSSGSSRPPVSGGKPSSDSSRPPASGGKPKPSTRPAEQNEKPKDKEKNKRTAP